jgi:DNA mismatch repair ATPase MutL
VFAADAVHERVACAEQWRVTPAQARLLTTAAGGASAARWGFRFAVTADGERVAVTQRPRVVGELLGAAALVDVARAAVDGGRPRAVVELLQAKACRHAIMFGDELTRAECCALLRHLARTQTPFRCAHGRPSVVVLCQC